jgi:hypothetical protein
MEKPTRARFLRVTLILFILAVVLLSGTWLCLPTVLETRILPDLARKNGFNAYGLHIRRLGLMGADVGPLRLGVPTRPGLTIDHVQIDYSINGLLRRHIDRIAISGLSVHGVIRNGRLQLRDFDPTPILDRLKQKPADPLTVPSRADSFTIGAVIINNAVAELTHNGQLLRLPFKAEMTTGSEDADTMLLSGRIFPPFGIIDMAGQWKTGENRLHLKIKTDRVPLQPHLGQISVADGLHLAGWAALDGDLTCHLEPFKVEQLKLSLALDRFQLGVGGVEIAAPTVPEYEKKLTLRIAGGQQQPWSLSIDRLPIAAPVPLVISRVVFPLDINAEGIQTRGTFTIAHLPSENRSVNNLPTSELSMEQVACTAGYKWKGDWHIQLSRLMKPEPQNRPIQIRSKDQHLDLRLGQWKLTGHGQTDGGHVDFRVDHLAAHLTNRQADITLPEMDLSGRLQWEIVSETFQAQFNGNLNVHTGRAAIGKTNDIRLTNLTLTAETNTIIDKGVTTTGRLGLTADRILETRSKAAIEQIDLALPWLWPMESEGQKGRISVPQIRLARKHLGSIEGYMQQTGSVLRLSATHSGLLFDGAEAQIDAKIGKATTGMAGRIRYRLNYEADDFTDLAPLTGALAGIEFKGAVAATAEVAITGGTSQGEVSTRISQGTLRFEKANLVIEGIEGQLVFPEIPRRASSPDQLVQFERAALGNLLFENGRIHFQLEQNGAFFVEQGRVDWCGGRIDLQPFRIIPHVRDYRFVVHCDRLRLSEVLNQLGDIHAEGDGTVNGKIPLRLKNKSIFFEDGFLYSTPGQEGTIRVTGTERLTTGIPMNTPQFGQLDLAREALKDYSYKWARLQFNTQDDTLMLQMQMDGKPTYPLPFEYDKGLGGFVRAAPGSPGSHFQGIRLDMNLRLPFNEFLRLEEAFQQFIEQTP